MIVLLHGSDRLGIDERVRAHRLEHDPSGINTTTFDQAATQLGDLRAAALAPGFFGTSRVVVARDLLTERSAAGAGRRARAAERDEVLALLAEIPPSTILIVVEESVSSADSGAIRGRVPAIDVTKLDVPRGRELIEWVSARAEQYGVTIPTEPASRLLEALFPGAWRAVSRRDDVPPDLYRLDNELAKLSCAARDGIVTAAVVDELVPGVESSNIWGLTDAIAAGDAGAAVKETERALATGAPPEVLIGQLVSQFETLAALTAGAGVGMSAVATETGLTEARLQQAARSARRFPISRLRRGLTALREIDVATKRGEVEAEDALLGLVARLAADR
ncbi:MAG TPA: DNA polymerase III subunit delta [Thermomicrobiaceae bacterium]|nr:DNA polymerase III subunit delta [Thermomicrobiaceae bacterium]